MGDVIVLAVLGIWAIAACLAVLAWSVALTPRRRAERRLEARYGLDGRAPGRGPENPPAP